MPSQHADSKYYLRPGGLDFNLGCSVRFCSEHTQNVLLLFRDGNAFGKYLLLKPPNEEIHSQFHASLRKIFPSRARFRTRQHDADTTAHPFL